MGQLWLVCPELAKEGRTATVRGQAIPAPDLFIKDVTAHAIGCCCVDATSPSRKMSNAVIISKNSSIPCQKVDKFFS